MLTIALFVMCLVLGAAVLRLASRLRQLRLATSNEPDARPIERLSLEIISQLPDERDLGETLRPYMLQMFTDCELVVWQFPERTILRQPAELELDLAGIWPWLSRQQQSAILAPSDPLPWDEGRATDLALVLAPILAHGTPQAIGGMYLALPGDHREGSSAAARMLPALESVAALISSALNQAHVYDADLRLERVSQELRLAGQIQSSLIPYEIPRIPGWQLSVTLDPAEETSGDFFDLIPFEDGKVGLVIADVVDKGIGAALYMALSRTLLRTYAIEADSDPATVFFATNARMVADTTSNLFVTAFYGLLDPETGELTYSNAGHNPPYVIRAGEPAIIQELVRTGIPIGVRQDSAWTTATVQLQPGDRLIMYTDGVPDAQAADGQLLSIQPVIELAKRGGPLSAEELQRGILERIDEFVGEAPQSDDITLMVLVRDRDG